MDFPSQNDGTGNDNIDVAVRRDIEQNEGSKANETASGASPPAPREANDPGIKDLTGPATTTSMPAPSPSKPSERPVKRSKRGKYISRACYSCQQRKIKCEGGEPCAQCVARRRPCVPALRDNHSSKNETNGSLSTQSEADAEMDSSATGLANRELLDRLAKIERQLSFMRPAPYETTISKDQSHPHASIAAVDHGSPDSVELQNVLEADGQSFAGELSMSPAFQEMNDDLDRTGINGASAAAKLSPALPRGCSLQKGSLMSSCGDQQPRKVRGWLEAVLVHHGVNADEADWRRYLQVFFDEVHVLYPFLHTPTVWEIFNELWEYSALWAMTNAAEREHNRMTAAVVCFCLALGRCSVSSRMADASGVHSSGWSLYSVGMSLMQDAVEMNNTTAKSLVAMQIIMLRVLYLFRLDATQRAARLIAVAVSNAHIVGLHRQSTLDNMPVFPSQLFCRTWWAIYVLDRRVAIESGSPFLIQDGNVDTALPLNLSDEWLSRYASRSGTTGSLDREISVEVTSNPMTAVPYLEAQVRLSRVVGRSWELLYGVRRAGQTSTAMAEYADAMLCKILDSVPRSLLYIPNLPFEKQFQTRMRWQVKQSILLFMSCTVLRLLIRRPFSAQSNPSGRTDDEELESVTVCSSLAASVLKAHNCIREDGLKYCFPFSHYLTSATMVMLGLVATEPTLKKRYGDLILETTRSLNVYCHRIWVSGKMMRWVSRLNLLVQRQLSDHLADDRPRHAQNAMENPGFAGDAGDGQLRSQSDTQDPSRTPYPQSRDCLGNQTGHGVNGAVTGEQQVQTTLTPEEDDHHRTSMTPNQHSGQLGKNGSTLWAVGSGHQSQPDLPGWAMSDFGFESLINGTSLVPRDAVEPGGYPGITGSGNLQNMNSHGAIMEPELENSIFSSLGPAGVFNLDFEVDHIMTDLEGNASPTL